VRDAGLGPDDFCPMRVAGLGPDDWGDREGTLETMTSKDGERPAKADGKKAKAAASAAPAPTSKEDPFRAGPALGSLFTKALLVALIGLGGAAMLGNAVGDGFRRFSYAYLTAYMWGLSIVVGGVFWVTLQNLVNAKWSVVLRRSGELIASAAPVMALLALPIVLPIFTGNDVVYAWANHEKVHSDHVLHHKAAYLNPTFFLIRFVVYFGFWTLLSRFFLKQSLEQDRTGAPDIVGRMRKVAGPGMIVFALTVTFCAIDLMMSLDPYWFSTIFGVYYFASCVLAINSSLVLVSVWLRSKGRLKNSVTPEHYHDLGKMMFAFTVFWAYIGFSQFMLIWYANLPEETGWYRERFEGSWLDLSYALLILHFVVPFFGLLSRHVKRNTKALSFWAFWVLGVIYLDMFWLIMPQYGDHPVFGIVEILALVGVSGAVVAAVAFAARNVNLVPVKDPRLERSLAFENI
jgi:hypothetical protein